MKSVAAGLQKLIFIIACALALAGPARAAITYVASSSNPADNGALGAATVTINFPAGIQVGDLLLIVASHREAARTTSINAAGGQSWTALAANTATVSQQYFWARYTGTGTSASVNFSDTTTTTVSMHAFRPTQTANTWAVDVGPTNTTFASPAAPRDVTIASINTVTAGALVFATWATADDNTWDIQTAGWSQVAATQYRNTQGGDGSQSSGYLVQATAGATGSVTNRQVTLGGDAGNTSVVAFREVFPTTTLATGTDPAAATIAPGAAVAIANNFTLTTAAGTETISSVTVNLSTATGVGRLSIYDNGGTERGFTTTPVAGSNTLNVTGMSATTTTGTFSVRITPLSHASMPVPAGGSYAITAPVTAWGGPNVHAGSDTDVNVLTIDNLSPNSATAVSGAGGTQQVTLNWTTSSSGDISRSVVLRWTGGAAGAEAPVEGVDYANGNAIGAATVACVRTGESASNAVSGTDGAGGSCSAALLAGNQAYTYKVYQKDASGNYDTGTLIGSFTTAMQPTLSSAILSCGTTTQVEVLFSIPVTAATAQTTSNYTLSGGASVTAAVLSADTRLVTLTVTGLSAGATYTLTVNNVAAVGGGAIAPGSQTSFFSESGYVTGGVKGTYYGQNGSPGAAFAFTGTPFDRVDATIDFNIGTAAPGIGGIGADGYSVRWQGYVLAPTTGNYIFRTRSDDGVRLTIDGNLVVNNWTDHSAVDNNSGTIALTAGQYYSLTMEFYENGGDSVAQLSWNTPTSGATYAIIPGTQLARCGASVAPATIYKMDESSWNGTAGEVADSGPSALNGTANGLAGTKAGTSSATPALAGSPGTCGYGVFTRATKTYVALPAGFPNLGSSGSFTVTAWIRTTDRTLAGQRILIDDQTEAGGWGLSLGDAGAGMVRLYSRGSSTQTLDTGAVISNNTWYFVAASVTVGANTTVNMYVYDTTGAVVNSVSATWTAFTWGTDAGPASIGGETNSSGEATSSFGFSGNIDEVRTYGQALTQAEIAAVHAQARPCASLVSHYAISFPNGTAGVTCEPTDVLITAHDASDAAIAPSAGATIGLSTSTGTGVWLTPTIVGTGAWSVSGANNGVALYTWPGGQSSFRVQLRHNSVAPTLTVIPTGGIGAVENSAISFADTAFRVTANGTSTASVGTQISGKDSNVGFGAQTLYLQAIRTDSNTGTCAGLLPGQTVNVEMAAARNNPSGGSSQVSVRNSGGGLTALSTGAGVVGTYGNVSLAFDAQSKAPLIINYPDAGTVTVSARYTMPGPPTPVYLSGATGTFVVRPFGLRVSGPTSVASPAASSTVFAKAGTLFNVTLTAVQWKAGDDADADGIPDSDAQISANNPTPNFGLESPAASATLSHALNAPAGGVAGSLGGSTSFTAFTGGAKMQSVSWSEVGFIDLKASSANYLASGQAVQNSSAGLTGVGRFTPDHFSVAASPAPVLANRSASTCTPASTFTYMDEAFTVAFTLEARNTSNAVTQNYRTSNGYAKLNPALIAQLTFGARSAATVLTSRLDLGVGSTGSFTNGAAAISATLGIQRAAAPDGPHGSLLVGIAPSDSDSVVMESFDLDADGTAGNERKDLGVSTEVRFGRLRVQGAAGSSQVNARVPLQLQYWNGAGFAVNTADSCTALAANTFTMSDYRVNLNACETAATGAVSFASGSGALTFIKPGAGNNGSLLLTANLGAATGNYCAAVGGAQVPAVTASRSYLQGSWAGGAFNVNPYGRVAFGVFGGLPNNVIFMRENY